MTLSPGYSETAFQADGICSFTQILSAFLINRNELDIKRNMSALKIR